jgi:hypothetical protein
MSDALPELGFAVRLDDGSAARAVALSGEVLLLHAERPYPPGKPVAFQLLPGEGEALELQGKSAGSKRREDGRFEVRIKLLSLRREQRARLLTLRFD